MKFITTLLFVFMLFSVSAQEVVAVVSPVANGDNQGKSIYISDSRSVYSVGEFKNEFTLGIQTVVSSLHKTVFFTKLNSQGPHEWLNTIKGSKDVFASKILVRNNQVIVGGGYSDSLFVG